MCLIGVQMDGSSAPCSCPESLRSPTCLHSKVWCVCGWGWTSWGLSGLSLPRLQLSELSFSQRSWVPRGEPEVARQPQARAQRPRRSPPLHSVGQRKSQGQARFRGREADPSSLHTRAPTRMGRNRWEEGLQAILEGSHRKHCEMWASELTENYFITTF